MESFFLSLLRTNDDDDDDDGDDDGDSSFQQSFHCICVVGFCWPRGVINVCWLLVRSRKELSNEGEADLCVCVEHLHQNIDFVCVYFEPNSAQGLYFSPNIFSPSAECQFPLSPELCGIPLVMQCFFVFASELSSVCMILGFFQISSTAAISHVCYPASAVRSSRVLL